jgi:hypothetical protein
MARLKNKIHFVGWVECSVTQRGRVLGYAALHPTYGNYLIAVPKLPPMTMARLSDKINEIK